MEVHLPIKPKAPGEQGVITVNIELMTQVMSKKQSVQIKILPEGSMVHRHTSVMLDLKSRANEYEYMNIIVDEVKYKTSYSSHIQPFCLMSLLISKLQ